MPPTLPDALEQCIPDDHKIEWYYPQPNYLLPERDGASEYTIVYALKGESNIDFARTFNANSLDEAIIMFDVYFGDSARPVYIMQSDNGKFMAVHTIVKQTKYVIQE